MQHPAPANDASARYANILALLLHDLRSPLVAVLYNAEMLSDDREIPAEARELARDILSAARSVNRTLQNAGELRRDVEGARHVKRVTIQLSGLLEEVQSALLRRATERQQVLSIQLESPAAELFSDRELLRGLVETLGEMSLRCAPSGSEIVFRASEDAASFSVQVEDLRRAGFAERPGLSSMFCEVAAKTLGATLESTVTASGHVYVVRIPK